MSEPDTDVTGDVDDFYLPARWSRRPPILDGEWLGSWISRVALVNGLAPAGLFEVLSVLAGTTERHWVDRAPSQALAEYIASHADVAVDDVLRSAAVQPTRLIGRHDLSSRYVAACPVVLLRSSNGGPRSAEDRAEDASYLAFCPHCLAEDDDPYFRRSWRTRLHTICERHGVKLLRRCPACEAPIRPHAAKTANGLCFCPSCEADLRDASASAASVREKADAEDTQVFLDALLATMPVEELARRAEPLFRRAVNVLQGRSPFWLLFFGPNEMGGGIEWIRRPATEWRDKRAASLGQARLEGRATEWGSDRLVPWNGMLPPEVGRGRLLGYANRYSDADEHMDKLLDKQIGALRLVGLPDTGIFVDDAMVGTIEPRPAFRTLLAAAKPGDTIVVLGVEFLGRSTAETMTTIQHLRERGLQMWALDSQLHTGSEKGRAVFDVVEMLEAAQRRRHVSWSKAVIMDGVLEGKWTLGKKGVPREKLLEGGRWLLAGLKDQSVGEKLGIALSTVRKHRQTMLALASEEAGDALSAEQGFLTKLSTD